MDISLTWFVLFLLALPVDCVVKTWINDPVQVAPSDQCRNVQFSKEFEGVFNMDAQQQLQQLILPNDGAIVLSSDSKFQFANATSCSAVNPIKASKRLWFSTKSWKTVGESENIAKAHVYKIPCECDTVEFPGENVDAIDLQLVDEIVADKILINGRMDDIEQFLETPIGRKMFLNSEAIHFNQGFCNPEKYCGCHNQLRFRKYTDLLCEEESKYCEEPHCLEPIQPQGHCCPICGAILNFKIKDTCEFNITNMNEVGRKLRRFRNGKYTNKLHYYAGMAPGTTRLDNVLQLVVAEVGDYTGISVEFMDYLTKDEHFQGEQFNWM